MLEIDKSKIKLPTPNCIGCPALDRYIDLLSFRTPYIPNGVELELQELQIGCWVYISEMKANLSGRRADTWKNEKGEERYITAYTIETSDHAPQNCPKVNSQG
ncbi:MAG: hypothetical protein AAB546_00935 [Patescibacteria group bacterium]